MQTPAKASDEKRASRSAAERPRPAKAAAQRIALPDTRPAAAGLAQLAAVVNPTGLPDSLKAGVEALSGQSLDHVRVHRNSSKPAQLNAHAYAQGSEIHVAPGQEKHLPHEAWHVVQQAQGRVKPTMQLRDAGVPINDDPHLEREADVMGNRAVQLQPAAPVRPRSRPASGRVAQPKAKGKAAKGTARPGRTLQRYLIVANDDITARVRAAPLTLAVEVAAVKGLMEATLVPAVAWDNTVLLFLQADAGGLVSRQLTKWIEDNQGALAPVGHHVVFGRKQQGRVYGNYRDLAMAIYGWVNAKQGRRDEKVLANQVYANPVIEAHMNALLAKLLLWIRGQPNSAAILTDLRQNNPPGANWATYRSWFNRNPAARGAHIPGRFYSVLKHPENFSLRDKIATLHDVMNYFMGGSGTAGAGLLVEDGPMAAMRATVAPGAVPVAGAAGVRPAAAYARPPASMIARADAGVDGAAAPPNIAVARAAGTIRSSAEETHPSFIFARANNIPMWGRHSYTAARMMRLVREVGGNVEEVSTTAWSIMAFWRMHYDHRHIPYHTLHEIMDFAHAFGIAYDPLNRGAGLALHDNPMPALLARLGVVAASPNWNNREWHVRGPRTAPAAVIAMRAELATGNPDVEKLRTIKRSMPNSVSIEFISNPPTYQFYGILRRIPDNIRLYTVPGTPHATKVTIATALIQVRDRLNAFVP